MNAEIVTADTVTADIRETAGTILESLVGREVVLDAGTPVGTATETHILHAGYVIDDQLGPTGSQIGRR